MGQHIEDLNAKMSENLLFFLSSMKSENIELLKKVLNYIEDKRFIESGEFTDHIMIMSVANSYNIELEHAWDAIE